MAFPDTKTTIPEQINHLSADPVLCKIITTHGVLPDLPIKDVYMALLSSIVSQQLSVKAALTIYNRFLALFPENNPKPDFLISLPQEELQNAGLSRQKSIYLKNVAVYKREGKLEQNNLMQLKDEELVLLLTQIKGVGPWSAEMILIFSLGRLNVFPVDDLGIQNAMRKQYGLSGTGKELRKQMLHIAESWKPYCSLASRYLWQSLGNN